jgi:hypothetical protein
VSQWNHKCLDAEASSNFNGSIVQLWTCSGASNQDSRLVQAGPSGLWGFGGGQNQYWWNAAEHASARLKSLRGRDIPPRATADEVAAVLGGPRPEVPTAQAWIWPSAG